MKNLKQNIGILVLLCNSVLLNAQNNSSSPLSMFGIGEIESKYNSENCAISGVATRSNRAINTANPAALSSLDSTSLLFDVGVKLYYTNLPKKNYNFGMNGNLDYISTAFPIYKNKMFSSISLKPYSSVGYAINGSDQVVGAEKTIDYNLKGSGGITSINWALAYKVNSLLSLGVTNTYLFGNLITEKYSDVAFSTYSGFTEKYLDYYKGYKCDFGMQLHKEIGKNLYSFGYTISPFNKLKSNNYYTLLTKNAITGSTDTLYNSDKEKYKLDLPITMTSGFSIRHNNKLTVSADCNYEMWQNVFNKFENITYHNTLNWHTGIEFQPNYKAAEYYKRIIFRAGYSYEDYYYSIGENSGNKQVFTIGTGFPLKKASTILSLNFEYINKDFGAILQENVYQFRVSYSLHDIWFVKKQFN